MESKRAWSDFFQALQFIALPQDRTVCESSEKTESLKCLHQLSDWLLSAWFLVFSF